MRRLAESVGGNRGFKGSGGSRSVEIIDFGEQVVVALALSTGDAVFDKLNDGGGFLDDGDVAGTYDEAAARREEAHNGVVALMTDHVAELTASAGRVRVCVGDLEVCDLSGVNAGPASVVEAFTIKVGARGAVDGLRVWKEIKECDCVTDKAFDHLIVHGVVEVYDGGIDVLFDCSDLPLSKAFVAFRRGELNAEGVLCPEFCGGADEGRFLVPREDPRRSAVTFPDVHTVTNGTLDLRYALVSEASNASKFNEATGEASTGKKRNTHMFRLTG